MVNIRLPNLSYDKGIIVAGDLHGHWRSTNQLISRKRPSIFLQCGDFGWWPKWHKTTFISSQSYRTDPMTGIKHPRPWNQYGLRPGDASVYFCPGNHEDWEDLETRATSKEHTSIKVHKNTFYMPRCSTLTLPDGRIVLFIGGALSTDKAYLKPGLDWFPEETIKERDMDNLPEDRVDIVISHTCPIEFKRSVLEIVLRKKNEEWKLNDPFWLEKWKDPSCYMLSHVLEKYEPSLWFFGHFHISANDVYRKTRWFALNKEPEMGWWMYLPTGEINEQ
jgi:hypothetical protein